MRVVGITFAFGGLPLVATRRVAALSEWVRFLLILLMGFSNSQDDWFVAEARKRPPAERGAFLDGACAGDLALRQRLEARLAAEQGGDTTLARDDSSTRPVNPADVPTEAVGQTLGPVDRLGAGRYKLLEKLGEGGCGVVYVAEQTEPVRRRVALKVIKLGMDTKQVVARFEAERQALAMMDHPNIAKVLDAGTTDLGRPYFVMELVRGIRITEYCDQANLSTRDRLDLFIKVCQAIQHAHQKGIIHRDIKPSNILVTLHDGVPVPKVIDFGIAKATEGRLTDATVYTQLHQFVGTPAYMSPEQAEMSGLDIDTRSDIYSLGVLLYELLAGRTPFDAKELMSQGIDAMRKTIREKEPMRPSTKLSQTLAGADVRLKSPASDKPLSEEEIRASARRLLQVKETITLLKGDLDWIVMKCLEKDRTRRYETANGLAADLKRHLNNEPVVARPPSTAYRFQKAFRRNKLVFAACFLVAFSLVAGSAVSVWHAVRASRARDDAEAVTAVLSRMIQSADPRREGHAITVVENLKKAASTLESDLAHNPGPKARLQLILGQTYVGLGEPLEAIGLLERAADHFLREAGPRHLDTLHAQHFLAEAYRRIGRQEEALELGEKVLARLVETRGPDHADTIKAMRQVAMTRYEVGKTAEAIQLCSDVLERQKRLHGAESPGALEAMSALSFFNMKAGRHAEALALGRKVLESRSRLLGPEHVETLETRVRLAEICGYAGLRDQSVTLFQETLPVMDRVFGSQHFVTVTTRTHLGRLYANWAWEDRNISTDSANQMAAKAERLLRDALQFYKAGTNTPPSLRACVVSRYGGALCAVAATDRTITAEQREKKYAEAEQCVHEAEIHIGGDNLGCQRDALERAVRLYEAWSKPEKLAAAQRNLANFNNAHPLPPEQGAR
jgi:serine/threonine protein kinase